MDTENKSKKRAFEHQTRYEKLIVASFLISLIKEMFYLPENLAELGPGMTLFEMFFYGILALLLGFAVSRLKSRIAAIFFLVTVALALFIIGTDFLENRWKSVPFSVGLISIIIDCIASTYILRWLFKIGTRGSADNI